MTTQKGLDDSIDRMGEIFRKNPALQQLLKDMHGYIVAPTPESLYFIVNRIRSTQRERWINPEEELALMHFARLYLHMFESFSPQGQVLMLEKLAATATQQTFNRFSLKK